MNITIYLKVVFTTRTKIYHNINSNIIITDFITLVKQYAQNDFNLLNVEIVDTEQNIIPSELGNALTPENITLSEKYPNKNYIAFYIRPISECIICNGFDNIITSTYYRCQHVLCENCFNESLRYNLIRCPVCRSSRNNVTININN